MASTSAQKIDSNFTGLRYAFEVCIGTLPGEDGETFATDAVGIPAEELGGSTPIWRVIEPNSYSDFGAEISTTQRAPITSNRQRPRGIVTDLDATAGFQIDYTGDNLEHLMPCFFFAAWHRTAEFGRSSQEAIGGITSNVVDGTGIDAVFQDGSLVILRNFDEGDNNTGLKRVTDTSVANQITLAPSTDDAGTDAAAYVKEVGFQATADDLEIDASGARPVMNSTSLDFTTLPLQAGDWMYIGGDGANTSFSNAGNNGFVRIYSIAANTLTFDKTQNTMTTEDPSGGSMTVQLFFGDFIKNEDDSDLIITRSIQLERSLSTAGFEYVQGCVANELSINVSSADKVTADLAFIGTDATQVETGNRKSGDTPALATSSKTFNTSSDFSRIRLADNTALQTPLFAFITELTLSINNNVTPAKAVGALGAFDVTVGDFVAEGSVTAYFSDIAAVQAVKSNTEVTFDFAMVTDNTGWIFDVPSINLGGGQPSVEKDSPITLPLTLNAARDDILATTLQAVYFPYLPSAAE